MSVQDDFTELVDADIDRVDLVGKAANGTRILFAKGADGEPTGLFEPGFVREMLAKADADAPAVPAGAPDEGNVTVTGRPGAVAAVMYKMHQAAVATEEVRKAQMSTADINDLPDSAFAHIEPGGQKDDEGKTTPRNLRHYPVHDEAHARDALGRAQAQIKDGKPEGKRIAEAAMPKIKAAAKKFDIAVAKADGDATDPGSPTWEAQDAANAEQVISRILACIPDVKALAVREATEVGAGHTDDVWDVLDLQGAIDSLTCAAKTVGAFAVSERAEAGDTVAKAQPTGAPQPAAPAAPAPKESIVTDTQGATGAETVAKAADGQPQPVLKAADLAAQLGITTEQLAEIGAQQVLKAARYLSGQTTQTSGAAPAPADQTARVIPGTDTVQAPTQAPDQVTKSAGTEIADAVAQALAPVVKQLGELATQVNGQSAAVAKAMTKPDDRRSPVFNGATGQAQVADRDHAGSPVRSPEFQAVLKGIAEIPDPEQRTAAQSAVALAAIKARFGHA